MTCLIKFAKLEDGFASAVFVREKKLKEFHWP